MAWTSRWPYCPCFGVSHLRRTVSAMTQLARVLGLGLDLAQALPRRGRVSAIFSIATLLIFARGPELLLEVARLRVEPIRDFVVESLECLGSLYVDFRTLEDSKVPFRGVSGEAGARR
jgi:hypothetical protein